MEERIKYLFHRFFDKTSTLEETDELMQLAEQSTYDEQIKAELDQAWRHFTTNEKLFTGGEQAEILSKILGEHVRAEKKVISIKWWKIAAAAAIILFIIGIGSYFLFFNRSTKQVAKIESPKKHFKNDVDPGQYKAKLTLADGKTILLDSAKLGE